jgi:hypothetical protein
MFAAQDTMSPPDALADTTEAPALEAPAAPASEQSGGPIPFLVAGAALVAGVVLAKWIEWRGHADGR